MTQNMVLVRVEPESDELARYSSALSCCERIARHALAHLATRSKINEEN